MLLKEIPSYFNYTNVLVFITFAVVLLHHNPKKSTHRILLAIVFISFLNELMALFLLFKKMDISLLYTVTTILHNSLWLFLLSKYFHYHGLVSGVIVSYISFSIFNLFFFEGHEMFNYYTFILGAFIYLVLFIYESFFQLKKENFPFFTSNDYIVLFAPVLFFFGLSAIFGFKSYVLSSTIIFGSMNLYGFIGCFVNTVYYILIAIYIYREKRLKNDT
ncbi:hypothetical protein FNW52_18960 [Flavobacterium sp. ZT3R18]|uniref:hypothetical protein n=1 Tax=Flavobacterium sp. ZT3R18 TaxID=2594429 RepID=UPI00117AD612|nr:hypothetical protein [Flavobacterium sp. ZT3R18]TRX31196.1 hypothetical protein FNW52_18960 [Flavobacterium sp. ZT3R18]